MKRRRVAVLFGGRSAEHEVSCLSARSVIDALDPARTEVIPIGITREGRWHRLAGPPALPSETGRMPEITEGSGSIVELAAEGTSTEIVGADGSREPIDVVFPVLHGPYGEDGTVQGLLELAGVPYVGAGVLGSAIGMDKDVQKRLFRAAGLPVGPYEAVRETVWVDDPETVEAAAEALGLPALREAGDPRLVRGCLEGPRVRRSSPSDSRRRSGTRGTRSWRRRRRARGRSNAPSSATTTRSRPSRARSCRADHEFYDYEAKYLDESGAELLIPADLEPGVLEDVQRLAVAAFVAVKCAGMARVDFFLLGEDELWLNELNTIPGFTSISMYPKLWEASGLSYGELVERLLDLAVERHEAERKSTGVRALGG